MMDPAQDRRSFLSAMGAWTMAGLATTDDRRPPARRAGARDEHVATEGEARSPSEYLFGEGIVYLDTAALGPTPRSVVDKTVEAWYELESNPVFNGYTRFKQPMEDVRARAAALLGCALDEMVVTHSTTEGMNTIAQGLTLRAGDRVLTTSQEHPGGQMCWKHVARRQRVVIDTIDFALTEHDPRAIVSRFADAITPATRVISVSHVLSSTGMRMPIAELSALARARGCLCIVDGAQAVGAIDVNVKQLGCHAYATSGHKWLMGPKGTGLLYLSSETTGVIDPMLLEDGRGVYVESTGVRHIPGVLGLGAAIDLLVTRGPRSVERHNVALRNHAYDELKKIPQLTVVSPPPGPSASPLATCRLPDRFESASFITTLRDKHRVIVKRVPTVWLNGIRISTHVFNSEQDIAALSRALRAELS